MKKIFLFIIFLLSSLAIQAQYPAIVYNFKDNNFNRGGLLPSETYFNVTGNLPTDMGKVEVVIFKAGKENAVYATEWIAGMGSQATSFSIPVKYKLRGNELYDVVLNFHRLTSKQDKKRIKQQLYTALDGYVDGIVSLGSRKVEFKKNTNIIMEELYQIVKQSLVYYKPVTQFEFPGYSDIVRYKIDQINESKMKAAKISVKKAKKEKGADARRKYVDKLLGELKTLLHNESSPYINQDAHVLGLQRKVREAETEKITNHLTLKAGYGLVYLGELNNDVDYNRGMYAGIVLPLGKPAFAPKIIQNGSFNVGVFVNNFEGNNGSILSGPIVGRPLYAGLGYKLLQFVKLDVGAVFLEETSNTGFDLSVGNVKVRPFVGLSAQIRFSAKID